MAENKESFFENKSMMMGTALIMILISFFLINWGVNDGDWVYWIGLAVLFIGLLLAPLSRFTAGSANEAEEAE